MERGRFFDTGHLGKQFKRFRFHAGVQLVGFLRHHGLRHARFRILLPHLARGFGGFALRFVQRERNGAAGLVGRVDGIAPEAHERRVPLLLEGFHAQRLGTHGVTVLRLADGFQVLRDDVGCGIRAAGLHDAGAHSAGILADIAQHVGLGQVIQRAVNRRPELVVQADLLVGKPELRPQLRIGVDALVSERALIDRFGDRVTIRPWDLAFQQIPEAVQLRQERRRQIGRSVGDLRYVADVVLRGVEHPLEVGILLGLLVLGAHRVVPPVEGLFGGEYVVHALANSLHRRRRVFGYVAQDAVIIGGELAGVASGGFDLVCAERNKPFYIQQTVSFDCVYSVISLCCERFL